MATKMTCKPIQETMVGKPTQDLNLPSEAIRQEEQEDFEDEEDYDNHDNHENEKDQPTIVLFNPQQLEVLLKMNRPNFTKLFTALKGGPLKGVGFKPVEPGNFDRVRD
jgi:hypothetical protein